MLNWGYKGDISCSFCSRCIEDRGHIFFQCSFSGRIWKKNYLSLCLVDKEYIEWEDFLKWGLDDLKSCTMKAVLCRLSWSAAIYHLWKQRNNITHGNHLWAEEKRVLQIKWEIRTIIIAKGKFWKTSENLLL